MNTPPKFKVEEVFEYSFSQDEKIAGKDGSEDLYDHYSPFQLLLVSAVGPENTLLNLPKEVFEKGKKYKLTVEEL